MTDDPGKEKNETADAEETAPVETETVPDTKSTAVAVVPSPAKQDSTAPSFMGMLLRRFFSISVRYKIAGTLIMVLGLAVSSLGIVTFAQQNMSLRQEMKNRAEILVQQLANAGKEGLLTKEELPVYSTITDIRKRNDVVYAMVMDDEGKVFAHNDITRKGSVLTGPVDLAALRTNTLLFQETDSGDTSVLDAAIPIVLKVKGLKIGVARIGLSEKALNESLSRQKNLYLWIALGFVVGGLLVSFALARMITQPLDSLAAGIQIVARGDLRRLVAVSSNDEIGKLTNVFNQMILSLREKLLMEKYLSQPTVQSIKEHRDMTQLKLGGERKYVTALFSDARGFTSLSEKMSPEDVVRLMNVYLNLQAKVIHQFGGTIDKFVGDEVMAIFEGRGNEINAVRAAVEIQSYCKELNAARLASGEKTISIGIGLNNGEVVMGNMGSEDHMDYTVIGDNINIAARMCGIAQPGMVLASKAIAEAIGDQASLKDQHPVMVKGKDQPIGIAEVVSVKGGGRRYMRKTTDAPATYSLAGFSDETFAAIVKNVSPAGCLLVVGAPVGIGSKLIVNLDLRELDNIAIRASVYHARKQDTTYYVGLCFEDLPEDVKYRVVQWVHQVNSEIAEGLML
jgi:class 3 adenylate cyclase